MKSVYDAAKLWHILEEREEKSCVMVRAAFPYLIQNLSDKAIKYTNSRDGQDFKGEVEPTGFLVIQPAGEFHRTDCTLHDFARVNWTEASSEATKTDSVITTKTHIDSAFQRLLEQNPELKISDLKLEGWCPSISQIRAYHIPPQLAGVKLIQPWGEQILDPATQVIVAVEGKLDCYANSKADFKDWRSEQRASLKGDKLVVTLPSLTPEEVMPAKSWVRAASVDSFAPKTR